MYFTLGLLLIPYYIFLFIFFILSLFNLYHLFRFGFKSFFSLFMIAFFLLGTACILVVTFFLIAHIDWQQTATFSLFNNNY